MIEFDYTTLICPVCGKVVDECPHFNYEEEDYEPPSMEEEIRIVMESE